MDKLVLIDGNSLFNRAFYATPVFSTRSGMPTNAVFGFTKLLLKIFSDIDPQYTIIAFDMKAPTFRHKMFDGYKATRKPMPEELAVQVEPLKNLLKSMKIAICEKEGIEADDILGTLSAKYDVHSYIYTGDMDSYQLVDDKTDVCFTKKGVSDILHLELSNFKEITGLEPRQIVDLKALMGDKSDNIPGITGIGKKTALNLLEQYYSLDGIYEHLDDLKGALHDKIANNKDSALLSYELATIKRDCDIDLDISNCKTPKKFSGEVKKLFIDLEFNSLLGMDIFTEEAALPRSEIKYPKITSVSSLSQLDGFFNNVHRYSIVLENNSVQFYADGEYYSVTVSENLITDGNVNSMDFYAALNAIFSEKDNTVVLYDYKKALHILSGFGIEAKCCFEDLSLIKYLCDFNTANFNFKQLCEYYQYDYNYSAFALSELYDLYRKKLETENMLALYEEIEKPLLSILWEMESYGVKVSMDTFEELSNHYRALVEEYKRKVYDGCGCEFNINSPSKLGEVLYNKLGITEVKKKKTDKYTTSAEVLEKLTDKSPVIEYVLKFRFFQKLYSTYIEGFRPLIDPKTNVVHTTYHQTLTSTGRLSSSNPNLQNIPIREDEGKELRKIFIPRNGNVFIDADYSQIELRLLAHFSGCKELIEAYKHGADIHALTASQVFGVPVEDVTPNMRRAAKAVNFGIIYGISDFGLSKNLNISFSIAKEYIAKYFETYSEVKDYMAKNVEFAHKNGYITTLTGRKRTIPEINSANFNLRQFGERAAMNMPLQGSSADIIKIAMINVCKSLKENGLQTKLILQVHDELVLEAPEHEAEKASEILKYEMENAVKLNVPLTVDVHFGKNWFDAK